MYGNAKNIANYLAKSETLRNIALPKSRCHTENTYFCRNTANFLSGVISFDDGTLASFREGFASFVTYIIKLSDQCQSPLKVELRRKASRLPYSLRNRLHLLISCQSHSLSNSSKVTLPNLSRRKDYTVAPSPCSASGAMMSLKATTHRCTNSLQNSTLFKTFTDNVKDKRSWQHLHSIQTEH